MVNIYKLKNQWSAAHARRGAEGGQCGGEDAYQHLNDCFPSFFFHVYQELENQRI